MKPISKEKFEQLKNKKKPINQENALVKSQIEATQALTQIASKNINNQNTKILIELLNKQNQQIETLLTALTAPKELVINHNRQGIIKTVDIKIVK